MAPRRRIRTKNARLRLQALERRELLSGIALHALTANGNTQLVLTYELQGQAPAFNLGFYRSSDAALGADTLLRNISISSPADLSPGMHTKTFAIGSSAGQIPLPGAGGPEVTGEYFLLAAADLVDAAMADNVAAFGGAYHAPTKDVLLHGGAGSDAVIVNGSQQTTVGALTTGYVAADVKAYRVRGHAGADVLDGSTANKALWLHGGADDDAVAGGALADTLFGGDGNDVLTGNAGNDQLDGGNGSDTYLVFGTNDGADKYTDTGAAGADQIVAGAAGALIRLGQQFSAAAAGIETISANGFANVNIVAASSDDTLNFTGVELLGIGMIDASSGNDAITGSAGDDVLKGGAGNDTLQGGLGRDVAVFAGRRAAYSITTVGGAVQVVDLDATANGNDGTDTLSGIETARFLDGEVTLNAPNSRPQAWADSIFVSEDSAAVAVNVLANDTDPDAGDTKRVVAVDGNGTPGWMELILIYGVGVGIWHPGTPAIQGSVSIPPDGQGVLYSSNNVFQRLRSNQSVAETITYTMADAAGLTSESTLTVVIEGANDAPLARNDQFTAAKNAAPQTFNVLANDTDVDEGDTRTVGAVNGAGLLGTVSVSADGRGVVYSVGAAFAGLGPGQTATETFQYTIYDGGGATSTAAVTVTILGGNAAPVAAADSAAAVENGPPVTIAVLANDTDADVGDTKRVAAIQTAGLQGTAAITADGSAVTYSVGNAFQSLRAGTTASETFSYTVSDAGGAQSTAQVTVTVGGVNDAPQAVANSASASEDAGAVSIDVLANDFDVDAGDTKTVSTVSGASLRGAISVAAGGGGVMYNPGSAFQYLRAGQTATETFNYTVTDGSGASATAQVTMSVIGANDAPAAWADSAAISEDAGSIAISVLANDTDADSGDTKRVVSVNAGGLLGRVTIASNGGSVSYSPGAAFQHLLTGQTATETFTYTMTDAAGAQSTATVTVTVTGATDGPIAVPDGVNGAEDGGPIFINVLANDTNDQNPGAAQTVVAVDGAGSPATIEMIIIYGVGVGFINPGFPAVKGAVEVAPGGGGVIYTPYQGLMAGQFDTDLFRYTISDGSGRQSSAIVSVLLNGANDAPSAAADAVGLTYNAASTTIAVLANDTDPDVGDTKTVAALNTAGLLGTAAIAPGGAGVVYTPGAAFAGLAYGQTAVETFSYTMVDSTGLTSSAAVTVTVHGVNHAPMAAPDAAAAVENGAPVTINVLANDSDVDAAAGDVISLISVNTTGLNGTAAISGNQVVYAVGSAFQSLRAGAVATETFGYTIADAQGLQSSANVQVTVTGVNDAPLAATDAVSVSEDAAPLSINVLDNDADVDAGDTKTIVSVNAAGLQGSVSVAPGGGGLTYTVGASFQNLNNGQTATETFSYTMRDGAGATSTATVTITVVGANEPVVYINPPTPTAGAIVGTANDDILNSGAAADTLFGEAGDDEIYGGGGADTLYGGTGDDQLEGGDGNDVLSGGAGRDDLTGDAGADIFRYYLVSESTPAAFDRIRDFDSAEGDKIDLNLIDASTLVGGNNNFSLVASFTATAGQLVVQTVAGSDAYMVRGDVTGDGVSDFEFEVRSPRPLTAADFLL